MHTHLTEMNFSIHLLTISKCFPIAFYCIIFFPYLRIFYERIKICGREKRRKSKTHIFCIQRDCLKESIWIHVLNTAEDEDGASLSRQYEPMENRCCNCLVASSFECNGGRTHSATFFMQKWLEIPPDTNL